VTNLYIAHTTIGAVCSDMGLSFYCDLERKTRALFKVFSRAKNQEGGLYTNFAWVSKRRGRKG
jgi:hypothetical protein